MNRLRPFSAPRPKVLGRRKPRTRPEAAAELVRVEYERDRLERDLAMLTQRRDTAQHQLAQLQHRAEALQDVLADRPASPAAPASRARRHTTEPA